MTSKSKTQIRQEFDDNAINWAARVGIEDVAIAKTIYWCVLNIYNMQQEINTLKETIELTKEKNSDAK